MLIEFLLQIMS